MTPLSRPSPNQIPIEPPREEPKVEPRPAQEWYPEPIWSEPKPEQIERNVVIMVFVAFIAGLLLGKIMNPVILKH